MTSGDRPVIGLSALATRAAWGVWSTDAVLLNRAYVDKVSAAGGVPVLLPPLPGVIPAVLPRLDGLVLTGGQDLDPALYGQEPGAHTQVANPDRDASELALLAGAVDGGMPVLGICRGMQVLNVARGGSLHQHLPDLVGTQDHAPSPGAYATHRVTVDGGSCLARLLGTPGTPGTPGGEPLVRTVPTYHHQGVDRLGRGLVVTARADDGTVEAVEDPSLPFCVAVQWHPEVGQDTSLFDAVVAAARTRLTAARAGA